MLNKIILLSGQISSGKSTLANGLSNYYGMPIFKTSEVIREQLHPLKELGRRALQDAGDRLDVKTDGKWVYTELQKWKKDHESAKGVIVDSVRINEQISAISDEYWPNVLHVHLTAPKEELKDRYEQKVKRGSDESVSYDQVKENSTEKEIETLTKSADLVIDTKRSTIQDVLTKAISYIDTSAGGGRGYVDVVIGGQFGSEGKGQISAFLSGEYDLLIRVGGPNAGHSVFEKGKQHIYHHLPSGTKMNGKAKLLIGPGAVIRVKKLLDEIKECELKENRLMIDQNAMIISDEDIEKEKELIKDIGSTGQGVGAATARRIMDRGKEIELAKDIKELKPFLVDSLDVLADAFLSNKKVLLEGTQGTGLSLYHGFYPHVTSRDTTVSACLSEAGIPPSRVRKVILVCRTYPIRVQDPEGGTSGCLRELEWSEIAERSGNVAEEIKSAEHTSTTKRQRRVGEFDWTLLRRSALLNGTTDVALTFTDYLSKKNREARRFDQLTDDTLRFIQEVERVANAPVSLISTGFNWHSVIDRRVW